MSDPNNTALPVLSYPGSVNTNSPQVGQVITCDGGTWTTASPPIGLAYVWYKALVSSWATIAGASGPTYTAVAADIGYKLKCAVVAYNALGPNTSAFSSATIAVIDSVGAPPESVVAPTIVSAAVGVSAMCAPGTWIGQTPFTYAYQWQKLVTAVWTNIVGSVGASYSPAIGDLAASIRCVVMATNVMGSVPAASNAVTVAAAPLVSAPGNTMTLAAMRAQARFWSDTVNDAHITDAELNIWLNCGLQELHDLLVAAYDEILTIITGPSTGDITLVAGTSSYAIPVDLYKLMGVDFMTGVKPYVFTCPRYMPRERNRYQGPYAGQLVGRLINGILVPEYAMRSQFIDVIPQPNSAMSLGKLRLRYVKQFLNLANDTDVVDSSIPNGWEEFAILSAAKTALIKQERDSSAVEREQAQLADRIKRMASDRDAGEPMRIVDVNNPIRPW